MRFDIAKNKHDFQRKLENYLIENNIKYKCQETIEFPTGIKTIEYRISRKKFGEHIAKLPHDKFFELFKLIVSNAAEPDEEII